MSNKSSSKSELSSTFKTSFSDMAQPGTLSVGFSILSALGFMWACFASLPCPPDNAFGVMLKRVVVVVLAALGVMPRVTRRVMMVVLAALGGGSGGGQESAQDGGGSGASGPQDDSGV